MSGWLGIGVTSVPLVIITIIIIFQTIPNFFKNLPGSIENVIVFTLLIILLTRLFKNSLASLRRLRPSTPDELASVLGAGHDRIKLISGLAGAFVGIVSFLSAAVLILTLIFGQDPAAPLLGHAAYTGVVEALRGNLVGSDNVHLEYIQQSVLQHGIGLDLITYFVSISVMALAGLAAVRRGVRKLVGAPRYAAPAGTPRGLLLRLRGSFLLYIPWLTFSILGVVGSACVLLAALLAVGMESLLIVCSQFKGQLLERIPAHWFNLLTYDCSKAIDKGYWYDVKSLEWLYLILFIAFSTGIFIRTLRNVCRSFGAGSQYPH